MSIRSRALHVRLGHPQGLLAAPVISRARFGRVRVAADLDADGDLDLVLQPQESGRPEVLLGTGDGHFQPAAAMRGAGRTTDVAAVDVDRDGRLDLATTASTGDFSQRLSVFRGVGGGGFQPHAVAVTGTTSDLSSGLLAGDVDGDGFADLVLSDRDGPLLVHATGPSQFAVAPLPALAGLLPLALADVDRDGTADLVGLSARGTVDLVRAGLQAPPMALASRLEPSDYDAPSPAFPADVTGDGRLDVVVPALGEVAVIADDGGGGFSTPLFLPFGRYHGETAVGDFDGDGREDVAVGTGRLAVMSAFGTPSPLPPLEIGLTVGGLYDCVSFRAVAGERVRFGRLTLAVTSRGSSRRCIEPLPPGHHFGFALRNGAPARVGLVDVPVPTALPPPADCRSEGRTVAANQRVRVFRRLEEIEGQDYPPYRGWAYYGCLRGSGNVHRLRHGFSGGPVAESDNSTIQAPRLAGRFLLLLTTFIDDQAWSFQVWRIGRERSRVGFRLPELVDPSDYEVTPRGAVAWVRDWDGAVMKRDRRGGGRIGTADADRRCRNNDWCSRTLRRRGVTVRWRQGGRTRSYRLSGPA
jgi:hypothetical protein